MRFLYAMYSRPPGFSILKQAVLPIDKKLLFRTRTGINFGTYPKNINKI